MTNSLTNQGGSPNSSISLFSIHCIIILAVCYSNSATFMNYVVIMPQSSANASVWDANQGTIIPSASRMSI